MQNKNVVMNKNCHSRTLLSGIYNACRCKMKKNTLLNRYVEDPRYQPSGMTIKKYVILNLIQDLQRLSCLLRNSIRGRFQIKFGMTPLFNKEAFTLIELLVVVLIIGILAAVAVPQYQKTIEISHLTKAQTFINTATKSIDLYLLEHGGFPTSDEYCRNCNSVDFMGKNHGGMEVLPIDLQKGLNCDVKLSSQCGDDAFLYDAWCSDTECRIRLMRHTNTNLYTNAPETIYWLTLTKSSPTGTWTRSCSPRGDLQAKVRDIAKKACAYLKNNWDWS